MAKVPFYKIRKSRPYKAFKRKILSSRAYLIRFLFQFPKEVPKDPIFIFNHIPKCGGSSLRKVLEINFRIYPEYPPHEGHFKRSVNLEKIISSFKENRVDYLKLKSWELIMGHYHNQGYEILNRFPDLYENPRICLITFLRDPLLHRLSMYVYSRKKDLAFVRFISIKEYVLSEKNLFARALCCDFSNYKEVMDRYFFIGVTERYKESLKQLKSLLNLAAASEPPHVNRTNSLKELESFTSEDIEKFKALNKLDYLIYEYGLNKLEEKANSVNL